MWSKVFLNKIYSRCRLIFSTDMVTLESVQKLEYKALQAENLISELKAEVLEVRKILEICQQNNQSFNLKKHGELKYENELLKNEIEKYKTQLIEIEKRFGIEPVQIEQPNKEKVDEKIKVKETSPKAKEVKEGEEKKKKEKVKPAGDEKKSSADDNLPVDVRRLDLRVGKIIKVVKHPDADSLYVEEVDLGEGKPRTVVSGLVKFVPIEEMQNRMVVALCNLKPAKMRGVTSEAMVLCASTPEKVEILTPPEGSCPGDKITVEGYAGEPDSVLNPKKKIFETVAPDLKTNSEKIATYKGVPFMVPGKGMVTAKTLVDVQIK